MVQNNDKGFFNMDDLCEEIWTMFFEHIELCEECNAKYSEHIGGIIKVSFEKTFSVLGMDAKIKSDSEVE